MFHALGSPRQPWGQFPALEMPALLFLRIRGRHLCQEAWGFLHPWWLTGSFFLLLLCFWDVFVCVCMCQIVLHTKEEIPRWLGISIETDAKCIEIKSSRKQGPQVKLEQSEQIIWSGLQRNGYRRATYERQQGSAT